MKSKIIYKEMDKQAILNRKYSVQLTFFIPFKEIEQNIINSEIKIRKIQKHIDKNIIHKFLYSKKINEQEYIILRQKKNIKEEIFIFLVINKINNKIIKKTKYNSILDIFLDNIYLLEKNEFCYFGNRIKIDLFNNKFYEKIKKAIYTKTADKHKNIKSNYRLETFVLDNIPEPYNLKNRILIRVN